MPSRRDQIQSQQFAVQRSVTALVAGEADPSEMPLRRLAGAALASVMVGVICLAAVGIFGLITGRGSSAWREGGSVVVERESGAVFVVLDGVLRPTANFSSAVLLSGTTRTTTVPRSALATMPRGPMVGIPNAPHSLPPASNLVTSAWSLCSATTRSANGGIDARTTLLVGSTIETARPLGGDEAMLVRLPDGETYYLVWRGYRYRIVSTEIVLDALAWNQAPLLTVGSAWLNALPAGRDIAPVNQNGRGRAFPHISDMPDARVGQVLVVETAGEEQYYLVGEQRLRPITAVEAAIVLADPATRVAYEGNPPQARALSPSAANQAPRDDAGAPTPIDPPSLRPEVVGMSDPAAVTCAEFASSATVPVVRIDVALPALAALPTERRTQRGVSLVDGVVIEPGKGAVVVAEPAPDSPGTTTYLVTDLGIRYPIPSPDALSILGYGEAIPVRMPASLVARLPEGPALDPVAAGSPVAMVDA